MARGVVLHRRSPCPCQDPPPPAHRDLLPIASLAPLAHFAPRPSPRRRSRRRARGEPRRLASLAGSLVVVGSALAAPRLAAAQRADEGPPRVGLAASSAFG